ncbi:hypothetical protein [Burkholderia gladioli]|uniref:hypothetical protein n=1 Tax=Burkholderia gladioli TaxID=28095 RepID=UPI00163DF951|nr:hypothetical protein [Burkholderia gladioli]
MSDKLSDDERARIRAAVIEECAKVCERTYAKDAFHFELGTACAAGIRALAASTAPAINMPPLNDAMRAVLTNENCVYGTPDELYAALVKAAPAIPADDPVGVPRALLASLVDDVEEYAGRHSFREREQEVRAREIARARVILAAPAISESEDALRDAEAGFEAFANSYDHDSNEWLDMDAQQTFIHGWKAAIKAGQYVSESQDSSNDNQFFAGICVALQVLTTHDQGVIWKDIVKACGVDDLLQYAANVEPEEWRLAGFAHFARRELGRRKPAARKGEKS